MMASPGELVMPRFVLAIITLAALLGPLAHAQAGIVVTVDKTAQRLSVSVDGFPRYEWPVSTARWGYRTPNGTYRPERLERKWFSTIYDGSPMPYSIFFNGGYAIHGSYEISRLGRPASHGCIRLHPENAAVLFGLVKEHVRDTQIVITGEQPEPQARGRDRGERRERTVERGEARPARRNFEDIFNAAPDAGDIAVKRWENRQ